MSRYYGRKFDIRHWVLLLHDGSMWALSDGSCRTASVPYIDGCWANSFVHLTNHSVQVMQPPPCRLLLTMLQLSSESFGQHEDGNELRCVNPPSPPPPFHHLAEAV